MNFGSLISAVHNNTTSEVSKQLLRSFPKQVVGFIFRTDEKTPTVTPHEHAKRSSVGYASVTVRRHDLSASHLLRWTEGDSEAFNVKVGLHQGSVLSPLLFVIVEFDGFSFLVAYKLFYRLCLSSCHYSKTSDQMIRVW